MAGDKPKTPLGVKKKSGRKRTAASVVRGTVTLARRVAKTDKFTSVSSDRPLPPKKKK